MNLFIKVSDEQIAWLPSFQYLLILMLDPPMSTDHLWGPYASPLDKTSALTVKKLGIQKAKGGQTITLKSDNPHPGSWF